MAVAGLQGDKRELFGGALECVTPPRFLDISNLREVADHQEFFADPDADFSIIIELDSYAEVPDDKALEFYWQHILDINHATEQQVTRTGLLQPQEAPGFVGKFYSAFIAGQINAPKGRDPANAANTVQVYAALFRLANVTTDLLVTFYAPTAFSPLSQSRACVPARPETVSASIALVLSSLKVNDWSIFQA